MWAHDFCLLFKTSITHNVLWHYAIVMQFLALRAHLIGMMMQVTECRYAVPALRYDLLCDGV